MECNTKSLKELQCHFNWQIEDFDEERSYVLFKLINKSNEIIPDNDQSWLDLSDFLTAAYELYKEKNYTEASNFLEKAIEVFENSCNEFLLKYTKAFQHIIFAFKANFVHHSTNNAAIDEIIKQIPPYDQLTAEDKAAIIGIKANTFAKYGVFGSTQALNTARQAMQENPNEAEWYLLVGIVLLRKRHYNLYKSHGSCVTEEEINCMEQAYARNNSAPYALYLAETYLDVFGNIMRGQLETIKGKKINKPVMGREYRNKSYKFYMIAFRKHERKSSNLLIRCANGLFSLQQRGFQVEVDPVEILETCLEECPSYTYGHTVAMKIYRAMKKTDESLRHAYLAEKGGCFGASRLIFDTKIERKEKINAEETFLSWLDIYKHEIYHYQIFQLSMIYYLFQNRNLQMALKFFLMAAEENMPRKEFKTFVYVKHRIVDICEEIYCEVKNAIKNTSEDDEPYKMFQKALNIFDTQYTDGLPKNVNIVN